MPFKQNLATPTIKGFEHINRYWDPRMRMPAAKILPGECYVSKTGEMIVTVVGSCVAVCIRDKKIGIGGMNHFMLPIQAEPANESTSAVSSALCYGNWVMEFLINEILKQGGTRKNLEVKLFGGGQVFTSMTSIDSGARSIQFVTEYVEQEGLRVVAKDLGSDHPRKVLYFSDTGAVKMKRLRTQANDTIQQREKEYTETLQQQKFVGAVELF